MASRIGRDLTVAAIALVVAVVAVAVVLVLGTQRHESGSAVSRGEIIFQTGQDANGVPIPRIGSQYGGGMMGGGVSGNGMMGTTCATCHGADGHGRSTSTFTAPNITYVNLTDPKGMLMPDGTRGPAYTAAGIQRAVTQGLDSSGQQLSPIMPRWQLTQTEWTALLAYLKTLR